ncbi:phage tail sheath protein [Brevibacillus fluminis]|uniref:Phage tail sheath protein n=1 Tax=Brevibacillus fluminis TaxID=511487 RepID=A0A3M8DSD1_9BACL|nr:phage tail sheath family protein [Brevibacillus fluminis]RNB89877.1 phage tail sheath protein [Brevibacillus fluminis]
MAGGTWIEGVEKVRAGLYMNFRASALERIQSGERGTVTVPLELNWGPSQSFIRIDTDADVKDKLGYDINDPEMIFIREAKKRAKALLVYRINTGTKATVTQGALTATAVFGGTRGNDIAIRTENHPDATEAEPLQIVTTLVKGREVDAQVAKQIVELKPNAWVSFSGTGAIPEIDASVPLANGKNNSVINSDYTTYLGATETQHFDVIAFPVESSGLKESFVAFIKRMREEEGKKIQGVVSDCDADYEGIINVVNGVVLSDGTSLNAKDAIAWVAGATAGASIIHSNTYSEYEGAVDANPRLKNSEIVAALKRGRFLFMHDGVKVKVEKDINSLVTYGQTKNSRFSKNRVLRVLDAIANDFSRVVNQNYIGKLDNNRDGQALLKEAANGYLRSLQDAGAIQNVDFVKDFTIDPVKSQGDEVYATLGVQPVDSMEKFFFNVEVR